MPPPAPEHPYIVTVQLQGRYHCQLPLCVFVPEGVGSLEGHAHLLARRLLSTLESQVPAAKFEIKEIQRLPAPQSPA